jgi:hypothetical protein
MFAEYIKAAMDKAVYEIIDRSIPSIGTASIVVSAEPVSVVE